MARERYYDDKTVIPRIIYKFIIQEVQKHNLPNAYHADLYIDVLHLEDFFNVKKLHKKNNIYYFVLRTNGTNFVLGDSDVSVNRIVEIFASSTRFVYEFHVDDEYVYFNDVSEKFLSVKV